MDKEEADVLKQLADILRGHGWEVEPPGKEEERLQGKAAAELDLTLRAYKCLRALYSDGQKWGDEKRHPGLTPKHFEPDFADGLPLSVNELARDFTKWPKVFERQKNFGKKSMDSIRDGLKSEGAL